ncbi:TetR/AcrR family transcriptional regulator [Cohnella hashimotonis]|uniref:TetR/AcrR family transcriptional regulator n=1 Tax=Cohnella hashimotonis TaxID=2826895 RepID=A0ABT6TJN9_9BACL|nr:TetR/AcrR family transcriptional regulator [Cohnella hashimotonis]MDI4646062.1 TetR/AcrR family transcriptional regulator [Cohnella hashimotonis]
MIANDESMEPWMKELLQEGSSGDSQPVKTEKQARILAAAIEVFAAKGYAGSSTSEIAQRAGVAEGTIFRHYRTKKDLLVSIVTPAMMRMMAPFVIRGFGDVLDAEHDSFEQFVRRMIDNRIEFVSRNKRLFRIVAQELPFHPEMREQFKSIILTQVLARMTVVVENFQRAGKIASMPPHTVARLTASTLIGYVLPRMLVAGEAAWDDEAEREATVSFLVKGLSP